jgi:lysyl-tRNA synthetase class 1
MKEEVFWADQKAAEILGKKRYHFLSREIPERQSFVVKTSASLSGVLHIGRLSDTIRADSVVTSLRDAGAKATMIWVAEDTDPLRRVPEGVPKKYEEYIGMPVTDVPDPEGCHASYAEHHQAEYLDVIDRFVYNKVERFSTREAYRRGDFEPYIRTLLERRAEVQAILGRYRDSELSPGWSPWKPICAQCGKVITPCLLDSEGTWVKYECRDYRFERTTARGCGHVGEADATRDDGKLLWKGEWASEWALWKVSCEGGGKEYEVPTSAWWVNGEIVERILDYPMPTPFFYEHLLIDGTKMSASLGNVVYPSEWLEVAPPELLRFLYNKKLMKTRSFSWGDLPRLYADLDSHASTYYGESEVPNEKERTHMKRLYEVSQLGPIPGRRPPSVDFAFAALIGQVYDPDTRFDEAITILRRSQVLREELEEGELEAVRQRLVHGLNWVLKHVPEKALKVPEEPDPEVVQSLSADEARALSQLGGVILENPDPEAIQGAVFSIARENGVRAGTFFRILYGLILRQDSGPRFGPLVVALGSEKIGSLLRAAGSG